MTLVLPGSAQLAGGSRRLGRFALRIWVTLLLLALLAGLLMVIQPKAALAALTLGPTLKAIQIGIIVVGLGWVALIVDAWRLAHPRELGRSGQIVFSVLSLAVAFTIFGGFLAAASMATAQHELTATVFAGGGDQVAKQGRYNILLLGGDAGPGSRWAPAGQHDRGQCGHRDRPDCADQLAAQSAGSSISQLLAAA